MRENIRTDNKLGKKRDTVPSKKQDLKRGGEDKKRLTGKRAVAAAVIVAGFLALIAFAVVIFAFDLGPVREIKSSEEEARVVGEVAGFEVRYEELRYITLLYREELDSEMGEYSSLDAESKRIYEQELEKRVTSEIKNNYVILSLCERYGIDTDSKEARKYVKSSIEELVDEIGGKKAYTAWLEESKLTDALLRLIYKTEYLETVLLETLTERGDEIIYSENELDDFVKFIMEDESYIKVIHAFYPKENKYVEDWDARSRADAALARIREAADDGARLTAMNREIGKAPFVSGYSVTGTNYYITHGQMHEDYEELAFSLGEYEVGEVLELEEGYYIIMRVPKLRDEVAPRAYEFIDHYRYAVLKEIEEVQAEKLAFSGNEYFKSLKLLEIK